MSKTLPNNVVVVEECDKESVARNEEAVVVGKEAVFTNSIVVENMDETRRKKCQNVGKCSDRTKKPKRPRCAFDGCKKRLRITDVKCRCESIFCKKHRLPENHECSFDYKDYWSDKIQGLGGGEFEKLNKL